MTASLIVSIDTEEEGLWGGRFDAHPTTKNLYGLQRFQDFCQAREVTPTYLIDAPVVKDRWAVERLRSWQDADRCEVGSHCHPWCNPPLDGQQISERSTFLCNLAASEQLQKLEWLTDQIEEHIGRRPTCFRAGRYGLDQVGLNILADLGYIVDSSVLPFRNYADQGGPDFREAPTHPYRASAADLLSPDPLGRVLEVPITSGFTRPAFHRRNRFRRVLTETPLRKLRVAGVLDRLNLLRMAKLSPEQANVRDAIRLIDAALSDHASVLVLMFHSSSLMPGYSPYVKTETELSRFYDRLDQVFSYCLTDKQCQPKSLTAFANQWMDENP